MENKKLSKLYYNLKQDGLVSDTEENFIRYYEKPENRQVLYSKLREDELVSVDFKTFNSGWFGDTQPKQPSPQPQQQPAEPEYSFWDDLVNSVGQAAKGVFQTVSSSVRALPTMPGMASPYAAQMAPFTALTQSKKNADAILGQGRAMAEGRMKLLQDRIAGKSDAFTETALAIDNKAEQLLPSNEQYDASVMGQIGQGFGSMVGMGLVPAGGILSSVDELQQDAMASGADASTVSTAGGIGIGIGALEYLPMGRLLKRLDKGGGVSKFVAKRVKPGGAMEWLGESLAQGFEESAQELLSNTAKNLTAQELYDSSRDLLEGAAGSAGVGFGVGTLAAALGIGLRRLKPKTVAEKALQQEALNNVTQVQQALSQQGPDIEGDTFTMPEVDQVQLLESRRQELEETLQQGSDVLPDNDRRKAERELAKVNYHLWQPVPGAVSAVLNPDTKKLEVYNASGKRVKAGKSYSDGVQQYLRRSLSNWNQMERVDATWDREVDGDETANYLPVLAASGTNAVEILQAIEVEEQSGKDRGDAVIEPKEKFIADNLTAVSPQEFKRFADKNMITGRLARAWLRKDAWNNEGAQAVEQLIESAAQQGITLTTDDVLRFMLTYDGGSDYYKKITQSPHLVPLRERFKQITGMDNALMAKAQEAFREVKGNFQGGAEVDAALAAGQVPASTQQQAAQPQGAAPAQPAGGSAAPQVPPAQPPPVGPNAQPNNPANPNNQRAVGRLTPRGKVRSFFQKYFTSRRGVDENVFQAKERSVAWSARQLREAEDAAGAVQTAIIEHYTAGLSQKKQKAQTALGLPISTAVVPEKDAALQNTMSDRELWERFVLWLPKEKREYLEKKLKAKAGTLNFQRRTGMLFANFTAQRANVDPQVQEIFDDFVLDAAQARAETNLYEAVNQVLEGRRRVNDLPEGLREPVRNMKQQIMKLENALVQSQAMNAEMIPLVQARSGTYVSRTYRIDADENWVEKIPQQAWDNAINLVFQERSKTDPAYTIEEAERYVRSVIDERAAKAKTERQPVRGGRPGRQDRSALMERADIAPEFRELFGEYRDPQVNFIKTVARVTQLVANHQFLKDIRDANNGTLFWKEGQQPIGARRFADVSNMDLAPLNGWYTTPELYEALTEMSEMALAQQSQMIAALVKFQAAVKTSKTVLNPVSAARNLISGGVMLMANGHAVSPLSLKRTREKLARNSAYRLKLIELGVLDDSVVGGQIREMYDTLQQDDVVIGVPLSRIEKSKRLGKGAVNIAAQAYQATDNIWRTELYERELAAIERNLGKQLGRALTPAEREGAERQAAERVREQYPTYSRAAKAIEVLKYNPFFSSFPVFYGESIRTFKNVMAQAIKEMKAGDAMGYKRMLGVLTASAMPYAIWLTSKAVVGVDDEEEEAMHKFVPVWAKTSPKMYMRDKDGMPRYIDLGWLNPYPAYFSPVNQAVFGSNKGVADWAAQTFKKAMDPFVSAEIGTQAIIEAVTNTSFSRPGPLVNPEDPDNLTKRFGYVLKNLEPGIVTSGRNIKDAIEGNTNAYGKRRTLSDELIAFGGLRMTTLDVDYGVVKRMSELQEAKTNARYLYTSALKSKDSRLQSTEYVSNAYEVANKRYREIQEEQADLLDAAQALGYDRVTLRKLLLPDRRTGYGGAGMSEKQFKDLYRGRVSDLKEK